MMFLLAFIGVLASMINGATIFNKNNISLCQSLGSSFSIALNATGYSSAENVCQKAGLDLAIFNTVDEVQTLIEMMIQCSKSFGSKISSGWINKNQPIASDSGKSFDWSSMAFDYEIGLITTLAKSKAKESAESKFAICKNKAGNLPGNQIAPKPQGKKEEQLLPFTIIIPTITIPPILPTLLPTIIIVPPVGTLLPLPSIPLIIPLPIPTNLVAKANPSVIAILDNLRIVSMDSLSPAAACAFLNMTLGAFTPQNLLKVIAWAVANGQIATFVDPFGLIHVVMPNGSLFSQLFKDANQISTNAVCQML
jgi:hypothetical protein